MINGILNIYKEKGYTSHDVVARLRESSDKRRSVIPERLTRMRKECFRYVLDGQQKYVIC